MLDSRKVMRGLGNQTVRAQVIVWPSAIGLESASAIAYSFSIQVRLISRCSKGRVPKRQDNRKCTAPSAAERRKKSSRAAGPNALADAKRTRAGRLPLPVTPLCANMELVEGTIYHDTTINN